MTFSPSSIVADFGEQHGLRGINHQPGSKPPVREAPANALDIEGRPSPPANVDENAEQRVGRGLPAVVSAVPASSGGRVNPRVAAALEVMRSG